MCITRHQSRQNFSIAGTEKIGEMALSRALNFCRSFSTVSSEPLRVCIVGSGPAGFYTADKILKAHEGAEVDIVDRLPTPFGLVRSGVAPDHPETKVVTNQFSRVAQNRRCSFIGNVSLGASISLAELRELYDAVVLSYGAESDQALGIPREVCYSWGGFVEFPSFIVSVLGNK